MSSVIYTMTYAFFFYLAREDYSVAGFLGKTPFHFVLYAAIIIAGTWFLMHSQTRSLFKTKRLLREKEEAIAQIENQRAELERKNKSITDSLIYAKRI